MSIGEALASMFAGAAGEAAGNRATEIRDEEKARLAEARELKMMALQQKYQTSEREASQAYNTSERKDTQGWQSGEKQKDRDFQSSERQASQAFQAGENAKSRAAAEGKDGVGPNGKRLQGTPQMEKDENGANTGRMIFTYRDGTVQVKNIDDLDGGDALTTAGKAQRETEANTYAEQRVKEKAGLLSSDAEDFKEYGGSRTKAKEAYKQEYLKGKSKGGGDEELPGSGPKFQEGADLATKEAEKGYTANQQAMIARVKEKYPDASDDQIAAAIRANPQYAPMFK